MKNNKQVRQAGNGAIIAIVIVLLLLLVGGYYVWKTREQMVPANSETSDMIEQEIPSDESLNDQEAQLQSQSTSDALDSIDQDLKTTSLDNI